MRETKLGRWLAPLVQLVPAAAVAAAVLVTLPRTAPVLAEVPARLSPAAQAAEAPAESAAEQEPAEDEQPALPYADGVYTGSSRGYGGTVSVQVTMENGHITDVQILSAAHETSAFLKRSRRLLATVLDAQTWEVDAVSEATYTSRGILGAVKNALTGEVVNNPLPPKREDPPLEVVELPAVTSAYRDGIYTASAEGYGGPITVQVTVADGLLADISIVSHEGESSSYFARARRVVSTMLESGTPEGVDSISGATYSSTGILNAVKLALAKAANEPEAPADTAEAETPAAPQYTDGVYTGSTLVDGAPVTVSVTVTDGSVASVEVLPAADTAETPDFWQQAKQQLEELIFGASSAAQPAPIPAYNESDLEAAVQDALQQAQPAAEQEEQLQSEPLPAQEPAAEPAALPEETPAEATEESAE